MEHRTYIPNNRLNNSPGLMSRMQQDLSKSVHHEKNSTLGGDSMTMLRRTAGRIPHVCVVGAGVAGLRCADVLLQNGAKVTIVEGRNRVGGRVMAPCSSEKATTDTDQLCQSQVLGNMVDLYVHPGCFNPRIEG